jgi:tetraacyldisaccharide 4'-kinase
MGNRRSLILYPFSILYRLITDIRNLLFNTGILQSEEFDIPLICVGNITVGGTGKTPHAEYLIDLLRKDFKVGLLSRGYRRKTKDFRYVSLSSSAIETGDEPLQIFLKFPEILVAVDRKRVNGINTIMKEHPETDVIILDDGFQHRRVKPGLSILLTDYNRIITRDYLMPYGNLRENLNNSKRADIIVVSKTPEHGSVSGMEEISRELKLNNKQKLFFTSVTYKDLIPLFENPAFEKPEFTGSNRKNRGAVLVTGIAVAGSLKSYLEKYFEEIIHLDFPDHHFFGNHDVEKIRTAWEELLSTEKILITTEKDAVRLREITNIDDSLKRYFYYIPVEISFLNDDKHEFDNMIFEYVRKNKRDDKVPEGKRNGES